MSDTIPVLQIPIVLASQSPRRIQLLTEAGFNVRLASIDFEEIVDPSMPPEFVAEHLAVGKADAYRLKLLDNEVLVTADTIVLTENGEILGKPISKDDASEMLRKLSGKTHKVITGVCLKTNDRQDSFSDIALVEIEEMSEAEIDYYVDKFAPYDKAGAYGIQEWIGHCKISRITGSYLTIMGLPVHLIYKHLSRQITSPEYFDIE